MVLRSFYFGGSYAGRIDLMKSYGYDCLIIWEHEIKNDPEKVINKLEEF